MDDLPLPQEADGCDDIGVIDETKDVIVGSAGFLLGGHILAQVGDGITGGLHMEAEEKGMPLAACGQMPTV